MNSEKWRVRKLHLEGTAEAIGWPAERALFAVWGIWPPLWDIDGEPLLSYMMHGQAMTAAAMRADFTASPPPEQQRAQAMQDNVIDISERMSSNGR